MTLEELDTRIGEIMIQQGKLGVELDRLRTDRRKLAQAPAKGECQFCEHCHPFPAFRQ